MGCFTRCAASVLTSNIGLCVVVVAYILFGAIIFRFLEADRDLELEMQQKAKLQQRRDDCLRELWVITERLNVLYQKNWTEAVDKQLRQFERTVVAGFVTNESGGQWSFSSALIYSVTVITTIGCGNLSPRTSSGKVVTILYAMVGVPLMLVLLSSLGSMLADAFLVIYSYICCSRRRPVQSPTKTQYDKPGRSNGHRCKENHGVTSCCSSQAATQSPTLHPRCDSRQDAATSSPDQNRFRRKPRLLTPEVRQLLAEHARMGDKHPERKSSPQRHWDVERGETSKRRIESEEEEDDDELETDNADLEQCPLPHATPSRVPLLTRASSASTQLPTPRVPIVVAILVPTMYLCAGAAFLISWEGWNFLDAVYICFLTLTTIGFGDMVPGKSVQLPVVPCTAYLLLGLVLVAMSFSLVQDDLVLRFRRMALNIGIIKEEKR